MKKRKPVVISPCLGRIRKLGFFRSLQGRDKDIFTVEIDMRDMDFRTRRKVIDLIAIRLAIVTGADKDQIIRDIK